VVRGMEGYGLGHYLRVTIGLPEENERLITVLARWQKSS
jgi:histidinol-phosphate/aromatic aminotransferase/cobyric acid decarboxylase-like protein